MRQVIQLQLVGKGGRLEQPPSPRSPFHSPVHSAYLKYYSITYNLNIRESENNIQCIRLFLILMYFFFRGACLAGRWSWDGAGIVTGGEDGAVKIWSRYGV